MSPSGPQGPQRNNHCVSLPGSGAWLRCRPLLPDEEHDDRSDDGHRDRPDEHVKRARVVGGDVGRVRDARVARVGGIGRCRGRRRRRAGCRGGCGRWHARRGGGWRGRDDRAGTRRGERNSAGTGREQPQHGTDGREHSNTHTHGSEPTAHRPDSTVVGHCVRTAARSVMPELRNHQARASMNECVFASESRKVAANVSAAS